MAYTYTGDASIGVSLQVEASKPLDSRSVVNTVDDLYSIPANYAYQGMSVVCISNGNIYVLVDKANIDNKTGWRASYESIQIITCTEAEYKEWQSNTTEDYQPIDESKTFIHPETYYYMYEDSMDDSQFYLSASWGKNIEEQLKNKAANSAITNVNNSIKELSDNLESNYTTTEILESNYVKNETLETVKSELTDNHYTKADSDAKYETIENLNTFKEEVATNYVTKSDLKGNTEDNDFIFVTQNTYTADKTANSQEFTSNVLNTTQLNISEVQITASDDKLLVNDNQLATSDEIPKIEYISLDDYNNKVDSEETNEDTYYYIYGAESSLDDRYVSKTYLEQNYVPKSELSKYVLKSEINSLIENKINEILSQS